MTDFDTLNSTNMTFKNRSAIQVGGADKANPQRNKIIEHTMTDFTKRLTFHSSCFQVIQPSILFPQAKLRFNSQKN
jgi:hypothetical protein